MTRLWRQRLLPRIVASHVIVVLVTTLLYGIGVIALKERLESVTFGEMLRSQLEAALRSTDPDRYFSAPAMERWSLYRSGALLLLPEDIRALEPGSYHSVRFNQKYWHLEVALHPDPGQDDAAAAKKMVLAYDITEWETSEHRMLAGMGIGASLVVLLALLLGWISNAAIVAPVTRLRRELEEIDPDRGHGDFARGYAGSEIEPIAASVDRLLARIDTLLQRERTFTAAASHELRSSLAVMRGALDLMEAQAGRRAPQPVQLRLRRAVDEMTGFVEAALFLARAEASSAPESELCDMAEMLEELEERFREDARKAGLILKLNIDARILLPVQDSIATIAVANLIRNTIQHSRATELVITLGNDRLSILDNGTGIAPELLPQVTHAHVTGSREGFGLGLTLVDRVCDRFGWRLQIESAKGEGTDIRLYFPPSPPAAVGDSSEVDLPP